MSGHREIIASTRYRSDDLTEPAKRLHILRKGDGAYMLAADLEDVASGDQYEIAIKYREADSSLRSLGYRRMASYNVEKTDLFSW